MSEQNVAVIPKKQRTPGHVRTKCSINTPKTRSVGAKQSKIQPRYPADKERRGMSEQNAAVIPQRQGASGHVRTKCSHSAPRPVRGGKTRKNKSQKSI